MSGNTRIDVQQRWVEGFAAVPDACGVLWSIDTPHAPLTLSAYVHSPTVAYYWRTRQGGEKHRFRQALVRGESSAPTIGFTAILEE